MSNTELAQKGDIIARSHDPYFKLQHGGRSETPRGSRLAGSVGMGILWGYPEVFLWLWGGSGD